VTAIHRINAPLTQIDHAQSCTPTPVAGNSPRLGCLVRGAVMSKSDSGYDYDRYRKLLAEADDESKRMELINLLIEEKARDKLAVQSLRARLSGLGLRSNPRADESDH
jgi:hypothetical protein